MEGDPSSPGPGCPSLCTNWTRERRTWTLPRCLLQPSLTSTLAGVHCPRSPFPSPPLPSPVSCSTCRPSLRPEPSPLFREGEPHKQNSPLHQPSGPGQSCCGRHPPGAEALMGGRVPSCCSCPPVSSGLLAEGHCAGAWEGHLLKSLDEDS